MHRLTISLDDDLYAMARAHAVSQGLSLSKAVADLLRRRVSPGPASRHEKAESDPAFHPETGFPIIETDGRPITDEDVRRMHDDEDVRHLELMGLSPEQIQEALER